MNQVIEMIDSETANREDPSDDFTAVDIHGTSPSNSLSQVEVSSVPDLSNGPARYPNDRSEVVDASRVGRCRCVPWLSRLGPMCRRRGEQSFRLFKKTNGTEPLHSNETDPKTIAAPEILSRKLNQA